MFDVPACDDPRIMVTINVPVKGRKQPVVLRLPRFDFIDEDQHDAIDAATKSPDVLDEEMPLRKRQRLVDLATLKPFVTDKDYQVCETLAAGQLQSIIAVWAKDSSVPLGELLASADSSTGNTGAPSSTTSTAADGLDATSAED